MFQMASFYLKIYHLELIDLWNLYWLQGYVDLEKKNVWVWVS